MKQLDCRSLFAGVLAIFIAIWLALCIPAAAADELRAKALWKQFREAFPNHLQVVALSERDKSNERVLLISEPPPWFGGNDLQQAIKRYMGASFRGSLVLHHPMGVDGWVTDLLVRFESRPGDEVLISSRIDRIYEDLFGTTYKAGALSLPVTQPKDVQAPANISPRATELKQWLFDDQVNLTSLTTGEQSQLKKLLCGGKPDTYFTDNIGLVVLLLPLDLPIDQFLFAFRHFAIDTDAILGAISVTECNRVAVVGRERTTSLIAMPPLRTEVFLRIAATKQKELGQSYERTAPFAGKLIRGDEAGLDWAPIYLSDDLLNTEFGSLLNITDQMLKSWSEAGSIEYFRFRYPKPPSFPFSDGAAKYLNAPTLTYNWNTTGVGSVTNFDNVRIFAVLNTGSLPVSFLPEGQDGKTAFKRTGAAEEIAYKYFRGLGDPNLATVVELAALYQIFQVFPVRVAQDEQVSHSPPGLIVSRSKATSEVLRSIAEGSVGISDLKVDLMLMLEAVEAGVPTDLTPILMNKDLPPRVAELLRSSANLMAVREKLLAERARLASEQAVKLRQVRSELLQLKELFSDDVYDLIAKLMNDRSLDLTAGIARLEELGRQTDTTADLVRKVRSVSTPDRDLALLVLLRLELQGGTEFFSNVQDAIWWVGNVEEARKQYQSQAVNTPQIFIKTPTIVLSTNSTEMLSTGGHNLYGRSTSVFVDAAVPRGTVVRTTVGEVTALRVNPDDASASSEIARAFERNSEASEQDLSAALSSAAKGAQPPREVASALQMSAGDLARTERGATEAVQGNLPVGMSGWKLSVDKNSTLRAAQRGAGAISSRD